MGRIKTQQVKRVTHQIVEIHGEELTNNFEQNKKLVDGFANIPSKKIKNTIAGYITRLKK
ncbi:MAG: 30S ribosomal protein S17e [archaeon]